MSTKQETFDAVARHLIAQGKPAMVSSSCAYRAPDGCKCAVGVLIPDDVYDPTVESTGVTSLMTNSLKTWPRIREALAGHDVELLRDLQYAHDGAADSTRPEGDLPTVAWITAWREEMRLVAEDHDLDASVLD